MPKVRKLTVDEVRTIERKTKGQRKMIEEQYDEFLEGYNMGDYGEAELEPDEKRITVRNRLKAAAVRRGYNLEFRRTKGDTLRFLVVPVGSGSDDADIDDNDEDEEQVAEEAPVSTEAPPAEPKRRGRRKKSETA